MKKTVTVHDYHAWAQASDRGDSFSLNGRVALFEYFEQLEEDTGEDMEFDPVAWDCYFSESEDALSWLRDNGYEAESEEFMAEADGDKEEAEQLALDFLRDHTAVIEFDTGIIAENF